MSLLAYAVRARAIVVRDGAVSHTKPVDERAGHRTLPSVLGGGETGGEAALVAPPLPEQLARIPADLRDRWSALWTSPVAVVLDPVSDLEPVTRLFKLYALGRRLDGAFERQIDWLTDEADAGQLFDPQIARVLLAFASEVRQLEQTLGVTPRGRLVIGAAVAAAGRGGAEQGGEHDDADD